MKRKSLFALSAVVVVAAAALVPVLWSGGDNLHNGSAMAGISADTPLLDYGLGTAMICGRFAFMIPVLAIAGSLAAKPKLPPSAGTFPTTGPLFVGLLIGVIIILGGLQFFPAQALGPIVEHFQVLAALARH